MAESEKEPRNDVDLQIDAARPKGSSGVNPDPRRLDAPVQENTQHVLGLRRPD